MGKRDTLTNSNITKEKQFRVDQALVKSTFLKYLPKFSGGRDLFTNMIEIGDLNGDNLIDGVVIYGLEPTYEDNGGGGNAIGMIPGLIALINTGQALTIIDCSEDYGRNFGAGNQLKKITKGVIYLEGLEYKEDDPHCCPSLETSTKIILRNRKLVKIK